MAFGMQLSVRQPYPVVVERVRAALQSEDLVIVTQTDLGEAFNREFGMDIPPQIALGVCTPQLARAALEADPSVGLLVPCSIVVRAATSEVTVVEAPTLSMIVAITGNRTLEPVIDDATARLRAAFGRLATDDEDPLSVQTGDRPVPASKERTLRSCQPIRAPAASASNPQWRSAARGPACAGPAAGEAPARASELDNGPVGRPVLTTARIRLEPLTSEHLPLLVQLDADAEVLRYILGRARSVQEAQDYWSPVCADSDADAVGLGWWVGWNAGGDFLGWWDLSPARPVPAVPTSAEAGWRLARRHWRQGYATEGARALLEHGFATVGLNEVWAETMAVNEPSRRVMTKLGMRHLRTEHRTWDEPLAGADQGEVVYPSPVTRGEPRPLTRCPPAPESCRTTSRWRCPAIQVPKSSDADQLRGRQPSSNSRTCPSASVQRVA